MILLSGFVLVDLVAADLPYLPPPGDIVFAPRGISAYPGGHPDNVASTLVRLGHDPKDVALIGAIGRDVFGSFLKEEMGSLGINLLRKDPEPEAKGKGQVVHIGRGREPPLRCFLGDLCHRGHETFSILHGRRHIGKGR